MIAYLNGRYLDRSQAVISIDDRGLLLSDGVFETARLVDGKYFRLQQHLDRFRESARQLNLQPPSDNELVDIFQQLATRNHLSDASLRVTLTRGVAGGAQTIFATLAPVAEQWREKAAKGWTLVTAATRRPSTRSVPAQLKALGRVYSILARIEAENAKVDDVLLLSAEDFVAEGPTWNFFWRKRDVVRTADLDIGVLEGVTRSILLQLAADAGYQIEEGRFTVDDVLGADEAFASMTSVGVVPIRSLDGRPFPSDDCAATLQKKYWDFVMAELGAS